MKGKVEFNESSGKNQNKTIIVLICKVGPVGRILA